MEIGDKAVVFITKVGEYFGRRATSFTVIVILRPREAMSHAQHLQDSLDVKGAELGKRFWNGTPADTGAHCL